jgi:hypothetical protein
MRDFATAYATWRSMPFPDGGASDATGDVHGELAAADAIIAEMVIPFVKRRVVTKAAIDVPQRLRDVLLQARALKRVAVPGDAQLADRYCEYAEALIEVYGAFEREVALAKS